jgi:Domain of unknown function (DUF4962)
MSHEGVIDNDRAEYLTERLRQTRAPHPRLHFDVAGREELRGRAEGMHRRYAQLLFEWVERYREWTPPLETPESALNEVVLEECGAFVTNAALAFVLSGSDEHLALARRWALAMAEVPRGELRNYGLGLYLAGLARAYDWLYDTWSAVERARLRDHLARHVRHLYEGTVPGQPASHWWAGAHLHHDLWVPVCGYGEAALALVGEVEEAAGWAARAKVEMDVALSWLGDDGAWHEGAADWCYALAPLLWFYGAWRSVTGENLHDVPWLRNTARYRLYHWLPDDSYVYLDDSFRSGRYNTSGSASCHLLRRLAGLFRDGHAQWLAERDEAFDLRPGPKGVYQAPYEGSSFRAERAEYPHPDSQCAAWNVLWFDPSVAATPPDDLPRSRHFTNLDVAILRSGWDDDAAVVSLTCGPPAGQRCSERVRAGEPRSVSNFSHAHADYGSLTLFARGQYFLAPPGYARRGSHFQNVVSVNGAEFRVDPALDVRLLAVAQEEKYCWAWADATAAFPTESRVGQYHRHVVLLNGSLVLFDDLRLEASPTRHWNRFQWALHSDPNTHRLSLAATGAVWSAPGAGSPALTLTILTPAEFAWERAVLESQSGAPMLEALRLVKPEWYAPQMQVLAVLSWEDLHPRPELVQGKDWLGVRWPERPERPTLGFAVSRRSMGLPSHSAAPSVPGALLILPNEAPGP